MRDTMQQYGVLVISHGSRDQSWVELVDEVIRQVQLPSDVPIFSSFLELVKGRLIQDGITELESLGVTDLIVIPLFISSGSTHIDEISYALGVTDQPTQETDLQRFDIQANVHFTAPIDDDPIIAECVFEKFKELSTDPSREIVLLIGHGSIHKGFHLKWRKGLEKLALRLKAIGRFDEVDVAMIQPDQIERKMKWWQVRKPEHKVIVAPLFLSEGYYTRVVIPKRLAGYTYRYNGRTLLPNVRIARWMEQQMNSVVHIVDRETEGST